MNERIGTGAHFKKSKYSLGVRFAFICISKSQVKAKLKEEELRINRKTDKEKERIGIDKDWQEEQGQSVRSSSSRVKQGSIHSL